MKRFVDQLGEPYSYYSILKEGAHVAVSCPVCSGLARITNVQKNDEHGNECAIEVHCTQCLYANQAEDHYHYRASGICRSCERWYNIEINNSKQWTHKHTHIHCPYCDVINQTLLQKTKSSWHYRSDIQHGHDPIFNLEYYYKDDYQGQPVWAMNLDHISYLIDYISADLREKPSRYLHRTASYRLPRYMKLAKNREAMVKLLTSLREK